MTDLRSLESHIKKLEEELLTQPFRTDPKKLDTYLADDFVEFGTSGNIWTKQMVIDELKKESFRETIIKEFRLTLLADNIALATYRIHHQPKENNTASDSLRCSIWKKFDGGWKIIFHQGTPLTE